jgi:hypothetical protein
MPTIFQRLDGALQGNSLSGQIGTQAGALGTVGSTLSGLLTNPPSGIAGLGGALQAMPAPNLDIGGGFAGTLTSLKSAVPSSLDGVTGGLTSGLTQLQDKLSDDIGSKLGEMIEAVQAIYQLTQIDFSGKTAAGGSGSGGGTGAGTPTPTPTPAPATQPPPSAAAMQQVNSLLDGLPSPLNVEGLITSFYQMLAAAKLDNLPVRQLLFIGELRDTLDTLFRWKAAQPADIAAELAATLQQLHAFLSTAMDPALQPVFAGCANVAGHLHADALSGIADGLVARLGEIQTATAVGSLAGATASITAATALLDQYDALKPTLQTELLGNLASFTSRLGALPDDLDDQMGRVVSVLTPSNALAILDAIPQPSAGGPPQLVSDLNNFLQAVVRWFEDLLAKIDLSAVQQPLKDAADAARSAVDALDNAMVTVTAQVQSMFGQVEGLLDQVDTAAIANQVKTAIDGFKTQLIDQLNALFGPVKDALAQVVTTIDQNVGAFDPSQIVTALTGALDNLTGVLKDPAVLGAVQTIQDTLHQAAQQLETFSFSPLTDQVIAEINQMADSLKAIDTSQMNPALQMALQGAVQVIPHDLTPLTNPLVAEFDKLIQEGPAPLLDSVKDQPKRLLDKVKDFQPGKLLGDSISKPYEDLLKQMDGFRPSHLLAPVDGELNQLKDRLKRNASPGLALKPLEGPFNDLLKAFDQLKPEDVVKPLDDAVHKAIDTVLHVIPVDAVFAQVDAVMKKIKDVLATGEQFAALLAKIRGLLAGLADPQSQLDAWLTPILGKLDSLGDTTALGNALGAISTDVDHLTAAGVAARFHDGVNALKSALDGLNPQGRLTAVIQAYRALPEATVDALPNSPAKAALKTMLARMDPMQPAFQAPFVALDGVRQALGQTAAGLTAGAADWDARYQSADGALASLRNLTPTAANVKQWIHDAAEQQVVHPLAAILGLTAPVAQVLEPVTIQVQALVTAVTAKINDLLLGPNSLGGIVNAIQALVKRLENLNFKFLSDSLKELFARVRGKLDAFNPAHLADALDQAFSDMLNTLSLATVLPADEMATLDGDYAKIIDKLKALDPAKLVTAVVQPEFDQKVMPLLDAFDLTEVLNAISDALHKLAGQLKSELDRVNQAFQAMLNSVPSPSLGDVVGAVGDLAASVGISL